MSTITLMRRGASKTIPAGFSYTTFFFGPLPSMIRGHASFAMMMIASDILSLGVLPLFTGGGLRGLFILCVAGLTIRLCMATIRNESWRRSLVKDGWTDDVDPAPVRMHTGGNAPANQSYPKAY